MGNARGPHANLHFDDLPMHRSSLAPRLFEQRAGRRSGGVAPSALSPGSKDALGECDKLVHCRCRLGTVGAQSLPAGATARSLQRVEFEGTVNLLKLLNSIILILS